MLVTSPNNLIPESTKIIVAAVFELCSPKSLITSDAIQRQNLLMNLEEMEKMLPTYDTKNDKCFA